MKLIISFTIVLLMLTSSAYTQIKVITSTSDLAYFAEKIGGDNVEVQAIASPKSDIHFIETRPSYMAKVAKADIVLKVGLELDKWMDLIIDGSRNGNLTQVDCSKYIKPLGVPTFKADARYGDIHPNGNPHYWIGPQNVEAIVKAIYEGLISVDPEHLEDYKTNMENTLNDINKSLAALQPKIDELKNKEVVYYHDSWPYFDEYTSIVAAGFIEPYPGVAPSPTHVKDLIELIKKRNIKLIAVEPYFDKRVPEKIAEETGAKVVTIYPSIGGKVENESYIDWLEGNINTLLEALK
ncbi:MAG: metal ABC transporter substrate-binding protein [bacterium]